MVYRRKSVSKMAAAAVAAALVHNKECADIDPFTAVDAVVVAVHKVIPDKAPASAAEAAKDAGASGALCTAIAAAVAAAAVGWEFEHVKKVSSAASKAFRDNESKKTAEIAKKVSEEVLKVSSRYPSVEAAAAAAYAAYLSKHPITSGSGAPGAFGGGASGDATRVPFDDIVEGGAPIAAANAAGEAAKAKGGPDRLSYAETAAARAATFRGANSRFLVSATVKAGTPTHTTSQASARASAELQEEVLEHVTATIAVASYGDAMLPASLGACGIEMLEANPSSHELIYRKLETIVALDTFLAGFLLFSLTGRKQPERTPYSEEVVQTTLQAYCFAVFLAATISAGLFMVVTGGTYALTKKELVLPTVLSTFGFGLLLVTVADAVYLELGEGIHHDDDLAPLFWATVIVGFIIQVLTIAFGVFLAMHGSKYRWHISCKAWPTARRVEYPRRGFFSGCCCCE